MDSKDIKAIFTQVDKSLGRFKKKEFLKWLQSKSYLADRYFSALIYYRCFKIDRELKEDYDHVSVVTGLEGTGKSWFAIQLCSVISPTFSIEFICYSLADFVRIIKTAQPGDSILLDEGGQFLYSRQAMSDSNIVTTKLLMLARQKNLHVCICIPSFYSIDTYIRLHRVKSLYHVPKRGQIKLIIKKGIKLVSKEGAKYQTLTQVKLPVETFHTGYSAKKFPCFNNLNPDTYKELKAKHLESYIEEIETDIKAKSKTEPDYISLAEYMKKVSVSRDTLKNWIKQGKLMGKRIGHKWFIHTDSKIPEKPIFS